MEKHDVEVLLVLLQACNVPDRERRDERVGEGDRASADDTCVEKHDVEVLQSPKVSFLLTARLLCISFISSLAIETFKAAVLI